MMLEYATQPTISWIYVVVETLKMSISDPIHVGETRTLCEKLFRQMNECFDRIYDDDLLLLAAYIDPALPYLLNHQEQEKAQLSLVC